MRAIGIGVSFGAAILLAAPSVASTETRAEYLSRLKEVCSVECLQPRDFLRKARKQDRDKSADMAVIMDVGFVRRADDKFELISMDLRQSPLEDLNILTTAGINASSRNGIGGLPRGHRGNNHPDAIIIELDEQAFSDFLAPVSASERNRAADPSGADILVEGEQDRTERTPGFADLNARFMNRRIVVRGKPELKAEWIGGRRDFRNKQVTLVVDNADDLVVLPRFDSDGNAVYDERQAGLKRFYEQGRD